MKDIINTNDRNNIFYSCCKRFSDLAAVCAPEEQVMMRMMKMLWKMSGRLFLGGGARCHLGCDRGRGFLEETPTHRRN